MPVLLSFETSDGTKLPPLTFAQTQELYSQLAELLGKNTPLPILGTATPIRFVPPYRVSTNSASSRMTMPAGSIPKHQQFAHLKYALINIHDACIEYGVEAAVIHAWVRDGFVAQVQSGDDFLLDEADVAYFAAVHATIK